MWPRHTFHRELSEEPLDAWLLDYETVEIEPAIVDPWWMYKFPCFVPCITTDFLFPRIYITPPLTQQEKPFESMAPTNIWFFLSSGTWRTSVKVLTTLSCILICTKHILTNLQGASLPMRMLPPKFSHMSQTNVCVDTYDKNNLSPIPIVHNVAIVVHQKPNRFPMRSHSEQETQ